MTTQPSSTILKIKPPVNWWKFALAAILIIFFILFGYYLFNPRPTTSPPKPDDILVTKLPTGEQLVENRSWGYRVKLPNDWIIEKPITGVPGFSFYSKDFNCKVITGFQPEETRTPGQIIDDYLAQESPYLTVKDKKVANISLDNYLYQGIMLELDSEEQGKYILAYLLVDNKIYGISVGGGDCRDVKSIFDYILSHTQFR